MKLYTHSPSPNCIRVTAVAHHLGLPLEFVEIEPHSRQTRTPEFLAMNPNGLVPTLEDNGFTLWESNAIMIYLAQGSDLVPQDRAAYADMWRWMCWGMCVWGPATRPFMYQNMVQPLIHHESPDPVEVAKANKAFHEAAPILEAVLEKQPFVVGQSLTLADFSLAAVLTYAAMAKIPVEEFPAIQAWMARIEALPAWQRSLPTMAPPA